MTTLDPRIHNITPTIDQLNDERRLFQLPVVVSMGVIMVAAIFGNVLVIYVYSSRKVTPASFFILLLAMGDLTSSCLCIPFQMFDLSNPYRYPVPVACKIFRFLETVVNIWCGLILMCIAFDRYFKICYPLQTYTMGKAKSLAIVMVFVTLSMSWPQLFLVGKRTVPTSVPGVFGEDCSTRDGLFGSIYSLLFQGAMSLLFGIGLVIFLLFYGRIFLVIWRRKSLLIGERYSFRLSSISERVLNGADDRSRISLSMIRTPSEKSHDSNAYSLERIYRTTENGSMETIIEDPGRKNSKSSVQSAGQLGTNETAPKRIKSLCKRLGSSTGSFSDLSPECPGTPTSGRFSSVKISSRLKIRTSRTTVICALVTLAGVVGFLPYLIVEVLRQTGAAFQPGMPRSEDLAYEFLSKSYFLNNIANPLIYSILNPQFRKDSRVGLKKLFKLSRPLAV